MKIIMTLSATRSCGILFLTFAAAVLGITQTAFCQVSSTASWPAQMRQTPITQNGAWTIRTMALSPHAHVAVSQCGKLLVSCDGKSWQRVASDLRTFFRGVTFARGTFVAVGGSYVDLPGVILTSTDGERWTIRRVGRKSILQSVAYGNGLFVVVGDRGIILTSKDGADWTALKPVFGGALAGVVFGHDRFVATGDDGVILASGDGRRWTRQWSGVSTYLSSVRHNGSEFVVTSGGGTITSGDGQAWTKSRGETNLALQHPKFWRP